MFVFVFTITEIKNYEIKINGVVIVNCDLVRYGKLGVNRSFFVLWFVKVVFVIVFCCC